jgi:hypothetical protein
MTKEFKGFCIQDRTGELLVHTLMDTERGAMVNWLFTKFRLPIYDDMSDEIIKRLFEPRSQNEGVRVVQVTITVVK